MLTALPTASIIRAALWGFGQLYPFSEFFDNPGQSLIQSAKYLLSWFRIGRYPCPPPKEPQDTRFATPPTRHRIAGCERSVRAVRFPETQVSIVSIALRDQLIHNILVWRAVQRESLTRQGSKAGKIRVRTGRESDRLRWEPEEKSSASSWGLGSGLCELLGRSGLGSGLCELLGRSGLGSGLCELLGRSGLGSGLCKLLGRSRQCCGPGDASCWHRHQWWVQHTSNQSWPKRCIRRHGGHLGRGLRHGRHDENRPWLGRHDVSRPWLGRHVVRLWELMVHCCLRHLVRAFWCVRHLGYRCGVAFLLRDTHSKWGASTQQGIVHKAPQTAIKLPSRKQRFDLLNWDLMCPLSPKWNKSLNKN